jgi:hypothetical protein
MLASEASQAIGTRCANSIMARSDCSNLEAGYTTAVRPVASAIHSALVGGVHIRLFGPDAVLGLGGSQQRFFHCFGKGKLRKKLRGIKIVFP